MKQLLPAFLLSIAVTACGNASEDRPDDEATIVMSETVTPVDPSPTVGLPADLPSELDADGKVLIMVDQLIAEDQACLVMMNVANGTDETVTAGLFAFNVTGNGATAGANMFPQTAEPGAMTTAQIILPGVDCADAQAIEGGQINCKIAESGESCTDRLELRDGPLDFTAND